MIKMYTNLSELSKHLVNFKQQLPKVVMQTINRTAPQFKAEVNRQVRKIYNYPLQRLLDPEKVRLSSASETHLQADLKVKGKPQSLIEFTKATGMTGYLAAKMLAQNDRGVMQKVKKSQSTLKHAFIAPGKYSKKPLVFWRAKASGAGVSISGLKANANKRRGKSKGRMSVMLVPRYPIVALYGVSIPQMMNNPVVAEKSMEYYASQFNKNLEWAQKKII